MAEEYRSGGRRLLSGIKEVFIIVLGAMVVSALLRLFVFEPFTIPSGSMENTLQISDKVVAQKVTTFKRGDVIVFRDPGEWVPGQRAERTNPLAKGLELLGVLPNSSDDFLTKRVIGMPGDHVKCCDAAGRVSVNDVPLAESAYLYSDSNGPVRPSDGPFEVIVPAGKLFVMGDHRNASADSRCHLSDTAAGGPPGSDAFVPEENVVGPVGLIVAPFQRWQQLRTPSDFDAVPAAKEPATAQGRIITSYHC